MYKIIYIVKKINDCCALQWGIIPKQYINNIY
jgi:hypothetical protein